MNNLARIPAGGRIFVDTNVFVLYYNDPHGPLGNACHRFLDRTATADLHGYTSAAVVAETIHRIVVSEAAETLTLPAGQTVEYLQKHPDAVRKLSRHLKVASEIYRMGIDILPLTHKELHRGNRLRANYGLMTNDSLIVAVMQSNKLRHLATHDAGFARVQGIQLWGPAW